MQIYVDNLGFHTSEEAVLQLFKVYGEVSSAKLIVDRYSLKSKGVCLIEMPTFEEAKRAVSELNGRILDGRNIKVDNAQNVPAGSRLD